MLNAGQVFSRWTVLNDNYIGSNGERMWLCRCECGTVRYVLERSLMYGGSKSCGCCRKDTQRKKSDVMSGRIFGDLTVLHRAQNQRKNGGVWWTCQCSCGRQYDCPATLLTQGRRTHCGCKTKRGQTIDISGKKFNRLTALYPLDTRDGKGSVIWHCHCDCGNEIDLSYNLLVYCNTQSCGCKKKEHDKMMQSFLTHVDGTSLDMIKSKKVPTDNTTGYKGVYRVRNKYIAKIVFQKKQYQLGTYASIEEAAEVRRKAEMALYDEVVDYYTLYRDKANADPGWEKENPIRINVKKNENELRVYIEPSLPVFAEEKSDIRASTD